MLPGQGYRFCTTNHLPKDHVVDIRLSMQNFIFHNPTKIVFGKGTIETVGKEILPFGKRVLMVYGRKSIKQTGIYDRVINSLRSRGLDIIELPGVKPNPVLSFAMEGIDIAKKYDADVILGVGGGSVIDTAKTIAVGMHAEHDVWDFFLRKRLIKKAAPVVTVVTCSASASEMNTSAVITNESTKQKYSINSPQVRPKTSILDPTALFPLPADQSAYAAVDSITHMLEAYFNNSEPDSPLQDRLVYAVMKTIMESTETILENPTNYNARANMMWSATLAFNGMIPLGLGKVGLPCHMIEHSLSALYDIPHGAGLAIILPGWMRYSMEKNPARIAKLARDFFSIKEKDDKDAAAMAVESIESWFTSIKAPTRLSHVGISGSDINGIASNAYPLARVWRLSGYTLEVISDILSLCL